MMATTLNYQVLLKFEDIKDSDVVVITAGFPRQPGMDREDLLQKNLDIMTNVATSSQKFCSRCFCNCCF